MDTVKKTFPVTGMHCAACALTIERTLRAQKGIISAGVNFANATALVQYDQDTASLPNIKKAVQATGYDIFIAADAGEAKHVEEINQNYYKSLKRKAILALIFALPLAAIAMFGMHIPYATYIMWALATPVVFVFGSQFFTGAWKQARHFAANMDTLVALSTGIAYLFSVFNTLYPQYWVQRGLPANVYFEASAVVIAFILLGKVLEERAKANASTAIKKLMGLQPNTVTRLKADGTEETVSINQVAISDTLLVKPGEKIAVDGIVLDGSSFVDESMLSGEPVAIEKGKDAKVFAGTINQKGSFRFRAEKVGADTLLAHIITKVQEAQGSKAPVQKQVDKIAGIFVPVVIGIAILSLVLWAVLGGANGLSHGLMAMVTVLVIACPCALGLATPTAIMVGIGKGAENGILIKDAESLETAHKVTTAVLDKTGTITLGHPEVTEMIWADHTDANALQAILYSLEAKSEHPLAGAITRYLAGRHTTSAPISSFSSITGGGVTAISGGTLYFAGSSKLIGSMHIAIPASLEAAAQAHSTLGHTIIWLSDHKQALGVVAVADTIKPTAAAAIKELQGMGIEVCMLTGDNPQAAQAVATQTGITSFRAETSPADKALFVKDLQQHGKIVAMTGDGINDSQALAQADVSIAMGKGTDIAMDVARITLISSDLALIPRAIRLSHQTVRVIHQNLFWAFIYNIIGIPLAAGILYPINGFLLNPMIAGAAMALSSVSVVSNSLRLKWSKI